VRRVKHFVVNRRDDEMFVRYFLFFILFVSEITIGLVLLLKHKCQKKRILVWSIVVFIVGFLLIPKVLDTYFMFERYKISGCNEANPQSMNNRIYLQEVMNGNRATGIQKIEEGYWLNDGEYLIFDETILEITEEIGIDIPVGKSRQIVFVTDSDCGIVKVYSDNQEFYVENDLYSGEKSTTSISIPASSESDILIDRILKCVLYIFLVGCVELFVYLIIARVRFTSISMNNRMKYIYTLAIGFFLLFFKYMGPPTNEYSTTFVNTFYFENYELGFLSRGLIGQILCEISPFWTEIQLYILKVILAVVFIGVICVAMSKVLNEYFEKKAAFFVVFFVLLNPLTGVVFVDQLRSDICYLTLYLFAVLIISNAKNNFWLCYLPLICIWIILINETTCLTIIPSIIVLLFYMFFTTKNRRYMRFMIISFLVSLGTTIISVRFGKGGKYSLEDTYANIKAHYGGEILHNSLKSEYFTIGEHLNFVDINFSRDAYYILMLFVMFIPIFYLVACLYRTLYERTICQSNKIKKIIFALIILMSFSPISAMVITVDYSRYVMIIFMILMTNFLVMVKCEKATIKMEGIYLFSKPDDNYLPFIIVMCFSIIGPFAANAPLSIPYMDSWMAFFKKYL